MQTTIDKNLNKNLKAQFAVYISDKPVIFKQSVIKPTMTMSTPNKVILML